MQHVPRWLRFRWRALLIAAPRQQAAISLLFCSGTLVCCALPAFLVLIGAGSVMAALVSRMPGLVLLSEQKTLVFSLAALALVGAGRSLQLSARRPCSSDLSQARRCRRRLRQARVIYGLSCAAFLVGAGISYGLPLLMNVVLASHP
jgi:hypothetical protein